jgi:hypothetical protein
MEKNMPVNKWKIGSIECTIWENEKEGQDGSILGFKTVSLKKSWKHKEQWHDAQIQLRRNDLQKVILILQKAQEELFLNQESKKEEDDD